MPDLTTHYLFGETVYPNLNEDVQNVIDNHRNVFNVGLQGPDLLFFHNVIKSPFINKSPLPKIGSRMHTELIKDVLNYMKLYIGTLESPSTEHDILSSYYIGYVCHYFLDKTVHPYVYYLVEKIHNKFPKQTELSIHVKVESEIDVILYKHFKNLKITQFPVKDILTVSTLEKNIIGKMYSDMIRELFNTEVSVADVMKSFDDLINASKLFYDKTKVLGKVSKVLNSVFPITKDITYHIKPLEVKFDTANLSCNLWHHPLYPEIKSHKSVLTMFYDAKEDVVSVINDLFPMLNSETPILFDTSLDFHGNKVN